MRQLWTWVQLILLCRVHAQALLVLDDQDFHERQEMLSLARHRAIATALNSLVFHTHCPAAPAAQNRAQAPRIIPLPVTQGEPAVCPSSMQNHMRSQLSEKVLATGAPVSAAESPLRNLTSLSPVTFD